MCNHRNKIGENMRKSIVIFFSFVLFILMQNVFAADLKIGILDINNVLENTPQVDAMKAKLRDKYTPGMKEITTLDKTLKADMSKYAKNSVTMKPDAQSALKNKIVKEQAILRNKEMNFQKNFMKAQTEMQQTILKKIQDVVSKIAQKESFDLVLVKDTVAFNLPAADISPEVIAELKK